jgi:hypothetical protein
MATKTRVIELNSAVTENDLQLIRAGPSLTNFGTINATGTDALAICST